MLPSFARDTVTRIRPGAKERRGSTEPDWDNAETLDIPGCSIQPATTTLSQDGRVLGLSEGYNGFFPPGADIKAGDRIRYGENVYTVIGEPKVWQSPTGRVSSTQATLERWAG